MYTLIVIYILYDTNITNNRLNVSSSFFMAIPKSVMRNLREITRKFIITHSIIIKNSIIQIINFLIHFSF